MAWHPAHAAPAPLAKLSAPETAGMTEQTDLNIDAEADHDHFSAFESNQPAAEKKINAEDIPSPTTAVAEPAPKSRWRPARPSTGIPFTDNAGH
jgi:hypothetical protein